MDEPAWSNICPSAAVKESSAIGLRHHHTDYILVRKKGGLYAYINACPHLGVRLDWQPNHFLDTDNELIQCATHGALFLIESGSCIYGPCQGQSLRSVKCEERSGDVFIRSETSTQQA